MVHFCSATNNIYQRLTGTLLLRRSHDVTTHLKNANIELNQMLSNVFSNEKFKLVGSYSIGTHAWVMDNDIPVFLSDVDVFYTGNGATDYINVLSNKINAMFKNANNFHAAPSAKVTINIQKQQQFKLTLEGREYSAVVHELNQQFQSLDGTLLRNRHSYKHKSHLVIEMALSYAIYRCILYQNKKYSVISMTYEILKAAYRSKGNNQEYGSQYGIIYNIESLFKELVEVSTCINCDESELNYIVFVFSQALIDSFKKKGVQGMVDFQEILTKDEYDQLACCYNKHINDNWPHSRLATKSAALFESNMSS